MPFYMATSMRKSISHLQKDMRRLKGKYANLVNPYMASNKPLDSGTRSSLNFYLRMVFLSPNRTTPYL